VGFIKAGIKGLFKAIRDSLPRKAKRGGGDIAY
jgi:hypothetical protein